MSFVHQYSLEHYDTGKLRRELLFSSEANNNHAAYQMQVQWPSYMLLHCERSAEGISHSFWAAYLETCERARGFQSNIQAMIIGDARKQVWSLAYFSPKLHLIMAVPKHRIQVLEFHLDGLSKWANSDSLYNFYPAPFLPAGSPRLMSLRGEN